MRALLLDFNGTLSDDEWLLCNILTELFEDAGRPLPEKTYYDELAGLSDAEIVERWLGEPRPDIVEQKIAKYKDEVRTGWTVSMAARFAVIEAAKTVRVAVVSGSAREEIEHVLREAQLLEHVALIVAAEDVTYGKPHPEGYRRALHQLGVEADDAAAVEDSEAGVAAAKAAGLYCVAVTTTLPPERLSAADELADRFDSDLIRRLVSTS